MHYTLKKILSSLASKILACVTLSFLLIFAGTRFIANVLGERVQKQTVDLFVCKIDNYCKELALELQGCESYISATSDVLQAIIQKKEELSVLESTINRWIQDQISDISGKGFVAGVGIWSVPEERARHPGEPEATYYSISRRRLFAYDELSKLAGGDYDYTRRPWYLDMLGDMKKNSGQPRKVFWSLPYRSLTTPQRDYFISLGTGLYYRDKDSEREKLAAMFVYDIYLESLIKGVELYQKETEASVLLISQRMNAILFEKYAYDLLLEDAAVDEDKASYWLKQYHEGVPDKYTRQGRIIGVGRKNAEKSIMFVKNVGQDFDLVFLLPLEVLGRDIRNVRKWGESVTIVLMLLTWGLILFLYRRVLIKPLNKLMDGVNELSNGRFDVVFDEKREDEIGRLGKAFNDMEHGLMDYLEKLKQETTARERLSGELNVAAEIQRSVLPNVFPAYPECTQFDIRASMRPARQVGGDFYDFCMPDKHTLYFVIADVSGKGVPAALFMMCARTIMRNSALHNRETPAEILRQANIALCENNEAEMFVTALMGCLDVLTGKLTLANAGHNPPVMSHKGRNCFVTLPHGFVLGGLDTVKYRQVEIQLEKGDVLYCYTDGVTEAQNSLGELFGEKRLIEALNVSEEDSSVGNVISSVNSFISAFVCGAEQADDITQLCLCYNGNTELENG